MSYRADKLGDGLTDGRTDAGNDNTRRPILASGKKLHVEIIHYHQAVHIGSRFYIAALMRVRGTGRPGFSLWITHILYNIIAHWLVTYTDWSLTVYDPPLPSPSTRTWHPPTSFLRNDPEGKWMLVSNCNNSWESDNHVHHMIQHAYHLQKGKEVMCENVATFSALPRMVYGKSHQSLAVNVICGAMGFRVNGVVVTAAVLGPISIKILSFQLWGFPLLRWDVHENLSLL